MITSAVDQKPKRKTSRRPPNDMESVLREQAFANKLNSQKSTGPRTLVGKSISAGNSTKFGMFSRHLIFRSSREKTEFRNLLRSLKRKYQPRGTLEKTLVDKMARSLWLQIPVEAAIDRLLLQSPRQEPRIRKFLDESNLPELTLPGLQSVGEITNWVPQALSLRLAGSQNKNDASLKHETGTDHVDEDEYY